MLRARMWSNLCCWHFPLVAAGSHPTAVHTLRTHVSRHGTSETYGGGRQTVLRRWTSRYGITFQTGVVSRHDSVPSCPRTMHIREAVILSERKRESSTIQVSP